jgi:hypothetical protein
MAWLEPPSRENFPQFDRMARCRLEIREGLPSAVVRGSGPPDTLSGLPMSDSPPAPDDTPAAGSSAAAHSFRAQAVLAGTGIDLGALGAAERPG